MSMTREEFKLRWESDDNVGGINFEDIAICAKAWGVCASPKTMEMSAVRYKVLKAANVADAETFNPASSSSVMDSRSDNLDLWHRVEKTDPAHTKKANIGGNKITAIAPQYQILNATKEFGPYGRTWGFDAINLDYSLVGTHNLVVATCHFFYPDGAFQIINSIKLYKDNACTKVDDDFAKKVETDALTKALSKLGFNADVFMGRFDDTKYVEDVAAEFQAAKAPKITKDQQDQIIKALEEVNHPMDDFLSTAKINDLANMGMGRFELAMGYIKKLGESGNE